VLHVNGIFKSSGACCMLLRYLRVVVRVVCEWNIYNKLCVLFVPGMFKRPVTYNTHHSS
jgi:hypothetical protein